MPVPEGLKKELIEIDKQIDRLSRAHADAFRMNDDQTARILVSMISRYCKERRELAAPRQADAETAQGSQK
jgi:hypothetical protein